MSESLDSSAVCTAVQATLDAARARVTAGKTQAAKATDRANALRIGDRFLVNGIVMLTNALYDHREPALNLQRAAWTTERPTEGNPRLSDAKQERLVTRDVDALLRNPASGFAFPLHGICEVEAFNAVTHYLERKGRPNDALLLLTIAESEQLKLGAGLTPPLAHFRAHQQRIITSQMERVDDRLARRTIDPCRLPAPVYRA